MADIKIEALLDKAKEIIKNNERVQNLLASVKDKLDDLSKNSDEKKNFVFQVQTVVRMVRAHFSGQYAAFSVQTILLLVFSLVYFVTPVDLIPDFIPALGLTDDISFLMFIIKSLSTDLDHFHAWEEEQADS